ncbi:hypothetical protein [Flavobacterium psychrolimnae]|uniref:hypothetical protein n=1 Tax=Flavobacterium psychrolimnae TaxID=249351 RepID=UPI0011BF005B|nr:hypothetical protein [Flavobacterium psychrolimnae]
MLISRYFKNVRFHKDDEAKLTSPLTGDTRQLRIQSAFNLRGEFANKPILENKWEQETAILIFLLSFYT